MTFMLILMIVDIMILDIMMINDIVMRHVGIVVKSLLAMISSILFYCPEFSHDYS